MVHDEFKTLEEEEGKAKKNTILSVLLLIFSFFGFLDTLYLSVKEILASPVSCFIFQGCSQVLGSSYSKIFGLPLSFYGLIFYLAIFVLTIRYLELKNSTRNAGIIFSAMWMSGKKLSAGWEDGRT